MTAKPLAGRTIAIPETRELDLFAHMLEQARRGHGTLRDGRDRTRSLAHHSSITQYIL